LLKHILNFELLKLFYPLFIVSHFMDIIKNDVDTVSWIVLLFFEHFNYIILLLLIRVLRSVHLIQLRLVSLIACFQQCGLIAF